MNAFVDLAGALYWAGLALLAFAALSLWLPRIGWEAGNGLLVGGLLSLGLSIAGRWIETGRPPVLGTFENTLVAAWMVGALALILARTGPFAGLPHLSRLLAPWAPLLLAYGSRFERQPLRLEAAGRSIVGYAHALTGWADFALLLAATMAAVGMLLSRADGDAVRWDESLSRLAGIGFALLTATMGTGALYSLMLFSDWYRWQLVETLAAAAWIGYGLLLHSRLLYGWKGRRLAWSMVGAFPLMMALFWIWSVYPDTYHYFERLVTSR